MTKTDKILLAHGSGGTMMRTLIEEVFVGEFADVRYEKMPSYKKKNVESLGELFAYALERHPECFARESRALSTDFSLGAARSFPCAGKAYTFKYSADGGVAVAVSAA